jgi:actin-like ATPase involved in cell morphogenesis
LWESTAEKIKNQIGAAIEDLETPPEDMSVQGRDLLTGKPKQWKSLIEKSLSVRQINSKN